jgi:hypothetical protein
VCAALHKGADETARSVLGDGDRSGRESRHKGWKDEVAEAHGEQVPVPGMAWTEEDVTPEGLVGATGRRYSAGDWVVTVRFPVVAPEAVIYQVTVESEASGFHWEGHVEPAAM